MISAVRLRNNQVESRADWDEESQETAIEQCLKQLDYLALDMRDEDVVVLYQNDKPIRFAIWPGDKWTPVGRTGYDTFEFKKSL
jgi:hypothetical protein